MTQSFGHDFPHRLSVANIYLRKKEKRESRRRKCTVQFHLHRRADVLDSNHLPCRAELGEYPSVVRPMNEASVEDSKQSSTVTISHSKQSVSWLLIETRYFSVLLFLALHVSR